MEANAMKGHASQPMQKIVQGLDGRVCGEGCHRRSLHRDCSTAFSAGQLRRQSAQSAAGCAKALHKRPQGASPSRCFRKSGWIANCPRDNAQSRSVVPVMLVWLYHLLWLFRHLPHVIK